MHSPAGLSIEEISSRPNERATTNNYEQQGVLDGTQWTQKRLWQRDRNVRKVRFDTSSACCRPEIAATSRWA